LECEGRIIVKTALDHLVRIWWDTRELPLWISVPLWFVLMGLGGLPALAFIGWMMQPFVEPCCR
jgi:hypothetical protein